MLCNSVPVGSAGLGVLGLTIHVSLPSLPVPVPPKWDPTETRESHRSAGVVTPPPGKSTISGRLDEVPPDSRRSRTRVGLEAGTDAPPSQARQIQEGSTTSDGDY